MTAELLHGQVELDKGCVVVDHPSTRANLPGVFTCGDLVDHHYGQEVTSAGTGCAAALDGERYIAALGHQASTAGDAAPVCEASHGGEEIGDVQSLSRYMPASGDRYQRREGGS